MADGELNRERVETLVRKYLGGLVPQGELAARVHVLDNRYQTIDPEQLLECIRTDPILARHRYKKEVFDCDDYVFRLKTQITLLADLKNEPCPRAVGCILTDYHALNFCITEAEEMVIINTQAEGITTEKRPTRFATYLRSTEGKNDDKKPVVTLVII